MSESMRKLITLVESMDTQSPMTMSDFVRSAKQSTPLNVIRDKEVIIKAYELYLKGIEVGDPKTPAQAVLQAQSTMQNMAFESTDIKKMFEEDESIQALADREIYDH